MVVTAAPAEAEREFEFSERDFEKIRGLIYAHAGIALSAGKRDMVYSRLARRVRAHGLTRFKDYLALLEAGGGGEWQAFINALTTNLTAFFREPHHFPLLAEHALRCWRKRRRALTLWCCAASSGEEAYSMAMAMVEAFDDFAAPVRILATDLDTNVLEQARSGVYALERVEKLPPQQLQRFFLRGKGPHAGSVRVRPELQQMIVFRQLNLLDAAWPVRGPFDAIFCRNVMIYFDKPTQLSILERFARLLPEGLLFMGHSECLFHATDLFQTRGKTVYEPVSGADRRRR